MEDVTTHHPVPNKRRGDGKAKGKKRAPPNETRPDKFVRLGEHRMTKVTTAMRQLCILGRDYPHTETQTSRIIGELRRLVGEVEAALAPHHSRREKFTF